MSDREEHFPGVVEIAKAAGELSPGADPDSLAPQDLEDLDELSIHLAREDPSIFTSYVFEWPIQQCHREWQDFLSKHDRAVLWAPIEHGKSSQVSVARPIWEMGNNPNIRSVIISSSAEMAQRFLTTVKSTIELNERARRVFPHLRPESRPGWPRKWLVDSIIVQRDDQTNKDPTIHAIGPLGAIMGARIDLAIFDDILNFHNTLTPESRKQMVNWIESSVISRLTVRGRCWFVGTAWHVDDAMHVYGGCAEEGTPPRTGWVAKRYDAEDMLWPELFEVDANTVYGWPRWRLDEKKRSVAELEYDRQFRNIALSDSAAIFRGEAIDQCRSRELSWCPPREPHWEIVVGVDLNIRKGKRNDETCLFAGRVNDDGKKQVLEIRAEKMGLAEILWNMLDMDRIWRPELFVVENNAAQDYVVQLFDAETIRQLGSMPGLSAVPESEAFLPRVEAFTTGANKADPSIGIRGMTIEFEQKRWAIPRHPLTDRWRREMVRFNPAGHTGDVLMASWFFHSTVERYSGSRRGPRASTLGGTKDGGTGIVRIDGQDQVRFVQ